MAISQMYLILSIYYKILLLTSVHHATKNSLKKKNTQTPTPQKLDGNTTNVITVEPKTGLML